MFKLFQNIVQALIFLFAYSILTNCIYAQLNQSGLQNSIRYNEKTNLPAAIYNVNSRQYSGTPEVIARQYLLENKTLFRLKDNLDDIRITEVKQSPAGYHVGFIQNYKGIPVMRSETVVSINHQNRISMVVNGYKPNIFVNTNPGINKEQALLLAKKAIDAVNSKEVFPSKEELMVYEDIVNIFHLVWKFFISPLEKGGEWLVVIDAHSGKVLEKFNTAFDYVNGKGRVFDPDPVTALRDPSLTDQNDADYPAIQPAYKDNVTLNDLNDAVGGLYYVRGRYGWSMDVRPPYDAVSTSDHPDNFRYKRNQNGFEEVNVYYFVDKQRRYIGSLGFNPTWKYLGSGSQTIAFDARGYDPWAGERNAVYYPVEEYMIFGVPASYVDAGEDQSVILHEYGHAFHDALMFGGIDNATYASDTRGISEGISDYLGIGYRRTTQTSPYRPNYRSNWFYPEAGESILSPSNAKYPEPQYGGHWGFDPYQKMTVWASTLMDIEYNVATDPPAGTRLGRDITTKLMLASLSFVTASSSVLDNVYAIFQADRDIPEYNGTHLNILASIFDSRGFFYYDKISGAITTNTTWSRYKMVIGDVTVNPGVTLTIQPGTFIFFSSGTKLIVNGTLNANGSSSNKITFDFISQNSTTQNEIKVNPGGSINISNSVLKNAYRGIYINEALGAIDNCEFYNCYSGIHLYRTNYTIDDPYITNNFSHDNQFGVVMYYSSPYLTGNEFSNNWRGVGCADYSSPYLGYADCFGNNYIHNNNVGVFAYGYSNPFLGRSTCTIQGGNNRIENNYYKELVAHTYCTILAENNWWGSNPPDPNKILVWYYSSIDYDPWLTSVPQFRQLPNREKSPEEQLYNKNLAVLSEENIYSNTDLITFRDNEKEIVTSFNPEWSIFWKLLYARNLIDVKKYKIAQKICKDIITTYPDSAYSYYALDLLWRASRKFDKDSLILFLSEISNIKTKKSLFGAAELILAGYDKNNRIKNLDKMIKKYKGEPIIEFVLFQKFLYYYYEENNMEQARLVAEELTRMFPDSESTLDAIRHLGENNIQLGKTLSSQESDAINNQLSKPLNYKLFGNYPNPFNPITTISYALPYDSKVEIIIYDLLGKKIKHFLWDSQTSGYHVAIWDGKNEDGSQVSSGIYIYRIKAVSLESKSETFEASSKLILTK